MTHKENIRTFDDISSHLELENERLKMFSMFSLLMLEFLALNAREERLTKGPCIKLQLWVRVLPDFNLSLFGSLSSRSSELESD